MEENTTIYSMPDEIILLILQHTSHADCNSFMQTCKQYNDLLKFSNSLWRVIYRKTVGKVIHNITASQSTGDWLSDLRHYLSLRSSLINLVADMSPKHFSEYYQKDISLENVKEVFAIALNNNRNYYCTITILQNFIHDATKKLDMGNSEKPYTLTEIHYAKTVVRYLIHIFCTLKWVQQHITNQLTPDIVLNFFTQWVDPVQMHSDEVVSDMIKDMVKDVDQLLLNKSDSGRLPGVETQYTCINGTYSERQVMMAISHYMYKQRAMVITATCNLDTLNIVKTMKLNTGHGACLGAIFQAIARGFGITTCYLIAFPNHLYLKWRTSNGSRTDDFQFSLDTGELRPSGRCPFSAHMYSINSEKYTYYSPDTFIEYLISDFLQHMKDNKGWHTDNAVHLNDFLTNDRGSQYCNFMTYLLGLDFNKLSLPFNIENIHEEHITYFYGLLHLNKPVTCRLQFNDVTVKHRSSTLKYSVGMICYHKVYNYLCVIRSWDLKCAPEYMEQAEKAALKHGTNQPFYYVTALDNSDRYMAQESLQQVTKPSRIHHIEDAIAKDFTHFNGFFYVPNTEKKVIFPDDLAIGNMYYSKSFVNM